jgi:hypothetical protein
MLLSAFNNIRVRCFRVVFIVILKGLVSFRRKIRVLFLQRTIK